MAKSRHETDVHDLSLGVIHAIKMMDVKALSYVQLRRLYAALKHAVGEVDTEIGSRSDGDSLGETVKIQSPNNKSDG